MEVTAAKLKYQIISSYKCAKGIFMKMKENLDFIVQSLRMTLSFLYTDDMANATLAAERLLAEMTNLQVPAKNEKCKSSVIKHHCNMSDGCGDCPLFDVETILSVHRKREYFDTMREIFIEKEIDDNACIDFYYRQKKLEEARRDYSDIPF